MTYFRSSLVSLFEAYGNDAEAALQAFANVDNEGWSAYVDSAVERQYRTDYAAWRRSILRSAEKERVTEATGQVRLFEMPADDYVEFRTTVVLDGEEHDVASLVDSNVLRKVAERDLAPAVTTVARCKNLFRLADHMDAESERLGREVTAGEVLGWAA